MNTTEDASRENLGPISWAPWLTLSRLAFLFIGWMALFAVISLAVSDPFRNEVSASATPIYRNVMFMHGMLVSGAGLAILLLYRIFRLRSPRIQAVIVGCTFASAILAGIGGLIDTTPHRVWWGQEYGFLFLDAILITAIIGMALEWRTKSSISKSLPFFTAFFGVCSMLVAAGMGHATGYLVEFGPHSAFAATYAKAVGFSSVGDFNTAMMGSHSHEMVVALMALAVALSAQQFNYASMKGAAKTVARVGMWMVPVGVVLMTLVYLAMGFTSWNVPNIGAVAGDDIITGILVMGGGLILFGALVVQYIKNRAPLFVATAWSWLLSFLTVVAAGYYIEQHESFFGGGSKAPGASFDATFTWFHQDVGLFLLPALVLVLVAAAAMLKHGRSHLISSLVVTGSSILVMGGYTWVFTNSTLSGGGFMISAIGLAFIGFAVISILWWAFEPEGGSEFGQQKLPELDTSTHPSGK